MKNKIPSWLVVFVLIYVSSTFCRADNTPESAPSVTPACNTYVLVHGAWAGGWAWHEVGDMLTAKGHKVYRATLTGQGERAHLASPDINLTTHVNDVVNLILYEDLHDVILVGHSYGGMVITGVMDRIPERIKYVIFLDAMVPDDGESMVGTRGEPGPETPVKDGFILPWEVAGKKPIPHDVAQAYKTWTEPVSFKNPDAKKLPGAYVRFIDKGWTPETDPWPRARTYWERAKARGWKTLTLESDHNAQWSHPRELAEMLDTMAPRS